MTYRFAITTAPTFDLIAFVAIEVATGHHRSASKIRGAALRSLSEQDRREERDLRPEAWLTGDHDAH
jgi:hypothetical protein